MTLPHGVAEMARARHRPWLAGTIRGEQLPRVGRHLGPGCRRTSGSAFWPHCLCKDTAVKSWVKPSVAAHARHHSSTEFEAGGLPRAGGPELYRIFLHTGPAGM